MEAMEVNEKSISGKMKDRKLTGIGGKDFYLAYKLISTRLSENSLVIATIALLVIISVFGASLSTILKTNGEKYYKEQYLVETVLSSSVTMDYNEGLQLYQRIQEDNKVMASCVYSAAYPAQIGENSFRYGVADINALALQGLIPKGKYDENTVILSQAYAEKLQCETGDYLSITSPMIPVFSSNGMVLSEGADAQEHLFQVAGIMPDAFFYDCGMYVDLSQHKFINDGIWFAKLYIEGETTYIEQLLSGLRSRFQGIKWSNYSDAISANNKAIDERFFILQIVVRVLVLIATIGWVNSIKNIFVSRTRDYDIIRVQGVRSKRVLKIMVYQILIYLMVGLITGFVSSVLLLEVLVYIEQKRLIYQVNTEILKYMLCIMMASCVILIPTMKKLCMKKNFE